MIEDKYKCLTFWDEVKKEDEKYWTVGNWDNALFVVDHKTGSADRICELPRSGIFVENRFCYLVQMDEKIVALPQNCYDVGIYDIQKSEMSCLSIPRTEGLIGLSSMKGFYFKHQGYIFSGKSNIAPIRFDLNTLEWEAIDMWSLLAEKYAVVDSPYFLGNIERFDNGVLFGIYDSNLLLYYDLEKNVGSVIDSVSDHIRIYRSYLDNEGIWILPINERALYFKKIGHSLATEVISIPYECSGFTGLIHDEDSIVLFPQEGSFVVTVNKHTREIDRIDIPVNGVNNVYWSDGPVCFLKGSLSKNHIFLYPCHNDTFIKINRTTHAIEYIKYIAAPGMNDVDRMVQCFAGFDIQITSEDQMPLKSFVKLIEA